MRAFVQNLPRFSSAGNAGTRRILLTGAAVIGVAGLVVVVALHQRNVEQPASIAKTPPADQLPGGIKSTPHYEDLAAEEERKRAAAAAAQGKSSMARMAGGVPTDAIPVQAPTPVAPQAAPQQRTEAMQPAASAPAQIRVVKEEPKQQPIDKDTVKVYEAAIGNLLTGWQGKRSETVVTIAPEQKGSESPPAGPPNIRSAAYETAQAGRSAPAERRPASRVLIPAGRGVYARTVTAGSSDQGGPVVVEALSGPIAGDRMIGGLERREDRLVVSLKSLTLQDGRSVPIDALLVAPDSMETAVASSVDQHYIERFGLPVAAAFVAGLGQAIALSGSSFATNPLSGGYGASYNHFNAGQLVGIGAGAAGAQASQLLVASAPHGPTVNLAANAQVGVLFLAPVEVPDSFAP